MRRRSARPCWGIGHHLRHAISHSFPDRTRRILKGLPPSSPGGQRTPRPTGRQALLLKGRGSPIKFRPICRPRTPPVAPNFPLSAGCSFAAVLLTIMALGVGRFVREQANAQDIPSVQPSALSRTCEQPARPAGYSTCPPRPPRCWAHARLVLRGSGLRCLPLIRKHNEVEAVVAARAVVAS
jgi:hypothetical protein